MENQKIKTGSKCTECDGRIALIISNVFDGEMDNEPYEPGIQAGNGERIVFQNPITITVHACDACGKVFSKSFEDEE